MTDAEKAFLAMWRMAKPDFPKPISDYLFTVADSQGWVEPITQRLCLKPWVQCFPIVASTFEALTIERPELREHYDRAREAWEASQ